jgi:hypothetical protein
MFILVFIVMFGPKKGYIGVYSTSWTVSNVYFNSLIININQFSYLQYTIITSRLTTYLLFMFWLFFFFFFWWNFVISCF